MFAVYFYFSDKKTVFSKVVCQSATSPDLAQVRSTVRLRGRNSKPLSWLDYLTISMGRIPYFLARPHALVPQFLPSSRVFQLQYATCSLAISRVAIAGALLLV